MGKFLVFFIFGLLLGNDSTALAASSTCLYTSIYNTGEKTWLLFNIVEKLALSHWQNENEFRNEWVRAEEKVQKSCGESWGSGPQNVIVEGNKTQFGLGGFTYFLQKTEVSPNQLKIMIARTSGNYANQSIMTAVFASSVKQFVHIVGRVGLEQDITRYDFIFRGEESILEHQSVRDFSSPSNIKSLNKIYGAVPGEVTPRLKVGVIGSGLDYNHPNIARKLAYRNEIERDLQAVEQLRDRLIASNFGSLKELLEGKNTYLEKMKTVGFPTWMDQALGLPRPFDLVMVDPSTLAGDHETKITSRIISRGDEGIQLHFARRMYGSSDIFDVETVMANFYKEGVRLVNMSFGSSCGLLPREEALWKKVFKQYSDVIFVVSAGNKGVNVGLMSYCPVTYSQENRNVISVTALGSTGELAAYGESTVNFGKSVDVAIKSDNLPVLAPYSIQDGWIMNEYGGTSVAAAEVTRVIVEAFLDGYAIDPKTVKRQLIETSLKRDSLKEVVGSSGEISETQFRSVLEVKIN